jgi:pyochelin biosynthesis protein PchG
LSGHDRRKARVVVCGTKFGRVYLAAFRNPDFPFELAGILARGSDRSRACAQRYQVPLFGEPEELPTDVDIACVVVGAGINGGPGADLAKALMTRGIHVLQEHPLHHDELADCLRHARQHDVVYHLNTHYIHLEPVHNFLVTARRLFERQEPLFVDATCAIQVAFPLFDMLGQALGRVRPWAFSDCPVMTDEVRQVSNREAPYLSLGGAIAGTPLTLRVQNQLDPSDPDNHAHILHRVTVGADGGNLTLLNTHGPLYWSPRPHLPSEAKDAVALDELTASHLGFPTAEPIGPARAPSYHEILGSLWPRGVSRALLELHTAIVEDDDTLARGQYYLTLCRLWQDATARLGYPQLMRRAEPTPLDAASLQTSTPSERVDALA